ncbi:hypothetical protein BCV71DRAFT_87468, partial [Rhizopus microsporus]
MVVQLPIHQLLRQRHLQKLNHIRSWGAMATVGVVNIDVRVPQVNKRIKVAGGRKRKATDTKKVGKKGTTTGHYLNFLKGTLDQLDKYPELK